MDISRRLLDSSRLIRSELLEEKAEIGDLISRPGVYVADVPPPRKASDYLKSSVGWVYACAGAIADDVALAQIKLFKLAGKETREVMSHPALDLLYRANSFTTKFDLFWLTTQYLELTGEAPWFISYKGSKPDQIMLLRPDLLTVVPDKETILKGYKYRVDGRDVPLEPNEVVFLRYPDPNSQFRGLGPLQAAARTVDIDEYSEEYNKNFFFNSARPEGVLKTEQKLGKDQLSLLEKRLSQKYRGAGNAHKTMILEKGLEYQAMSLSQKDMDFIEQQKFARDKILGIFRVPKSVVGIVEDVNRANAEASDYIFAKRTIKPKLERIVQQLTEFLLPLFPGTDGMYFDYESPVPEDKKARLDEKKAGISGGWLTINEVRAMDGLEPIGEQGDVVRVPSTLVEIGQEPANPPMKILADRIHQAKKRMLPDHVKKEISDIEQALVKLAKKAILKKRGRKPKKDTVSLDQENPEFVALQNKQLSIADDFEARFKSKIVGVFNAQLKDILAKMPAKSKGLSWQEFLLLPDTEKERFAKALSELFTQLIVAQSVEAFNFIGSSDRFNETNPAVVRYLEKRAFKFVEPVTKLTNKMLSKQFRAGIAAGESIPKLRKRVQTVFSDMEKYRSERIARTETIRASNYASIESWKESGVVQSKQWLTNFDERTCQWCSPMNGKTLGLSDSYFERGATFQGIEGDPLNLDFEDVSGPPLHPNCRCTLVPIVTKSAQILSQKNREDEEFNKQVDDLNDRVAKILSNHE